MTSCESAYPSVPVSLSVSTRSWRLICVVATDVLAESPDALLDPPPEVATTIADARHDRDDDGRRDTAAAESWPPGGDVLSAGRRRGVLPVSRGLLLILDRHDQLPPPPPGPPGPPWPRCGSLSWQAFVAAWTFGSL